MDIINELWYGNVSPFEQCTRGDKRLKELLKPFFCHWVRTKNSTPNTDQASENPMPIIFDKIQPFSQNHQCLP